MELVLIIIGVFIMFYLARAFDARELNEKFKREEGKKEKKDHSNLL